MAHLFGKITNKVKHFPLAKVLRKKKWEKHAFVNMLSARTVRNLENHPEMRSEVIQNYCKNHPEIAGKMIEQIKKCIANSMYSNDRENGELIDDMLFCRLAYGFSEEEYLAYGFKQKKTVERLEFVSERESIYFGYHVNDLDKMGIFADKMRTYDMFKSYYKREAIAVSKPSDYDEFCAFADRHARFMKKNVFEACGRSIELIDGIVDKRALFQRFIAEGKVILEEVVQQGKELAVFNASSVNTIRCITMKDAGRITTPYCFMKVGRKGQFVDNGAAGGILIGIDAKTGMLNTDGIDEVANHYPVHPDSGIHFVAYQLPHWNEMISMCKEMAAMVPEMRVIGWDMAYTENGWVIIEGNALTEVIGMQSTSGKGIRAEIVQYLKRNGLHTAQLESRIMRA